MNQAKRRMMGLALVLLAGCREPASSSSVTQKEPGQCQACCCTPADPTADEPSAESSTMSRWLAPADRTVAGFAAFEFVNQAGTRLSFAQLAGKPLALSFVYTRCQNQNKCPLITSSMVKLQAELAKQALQDRVRLAIMTYDPEHDDPAVLRDYGRRHGLTLDAHCMLLRPDVSTKARLFEELGASVNFNEEGVNIHGIQMVLLDRQGRLARRYHSLIWRQDDVVADLKRLCAEE